MTAILLGNQPQALEFTFNSKSSVQTFLKRNDRALRTKFKFIRFLGKSSAEFQNLVQAKDVLALRLLRSKTQVLW